MQLVKSHGLGNDYLVLASGEELTPSLARALCDRHTGVGGDGVLQPVASTRADYGLRIWNPDGSQAEKSGNGLRIFARWLVDHQMAPMAFSVEVPGGVVACVVHDTGAVTVEMGPPEWRPTAIPCTDLLANTPVEVDGATLHLTAVSMGNPHCVAVFEPGTDLDSLPWRAWGAALERDPRFPNRTNVQFAAAVDRGRVAARIWERGAGETRASGSSACAVAAVLHRQGAVDEAVEVVMPGGSLHLRVRPGGVEMRGPVEEICVVHLSRRLP